MIVAKFGEKNALVTIPSHGFIPVHVGHVLKHGLVLKGLEGVVVIIRAGFAANRVHVVG